ncbi:rRNA-processing protein fcf2 [Morella rubra]|uniref:rRNA-processing protein fcf2 n=1 Tax=Morella rubra TaxID=262757 RepID=A0A6A1VP89_9ROSI|nr:rRNA-processing protein fcf2 [Morella rubra]KAB1213756.1 rRNA-processing protein fcf2 [Morella rubra]
MPESKPVIGLSWEPKLPTFSSGTHNGSVNKSQNQTETSALWRPNSELVDGLFVPPNAPRKLNKLMRKQLKDTAGKSWFEMPAQTITPELEKDLRLLKLRGAIDPKRHYKKGDSKSKSLPKYFQASLFVGTVMESASDFFTGRLTKKERKATIADELLSDRTLAQYSQNILPNEAVISVCGMSYFFLFAHVENFCRKRKVREIEEKNRPAGNEKWKRKSRQSRKHTKQRRH